MLTVLLRRLLGVLRLNAATFEEIEADSRATPQALCVVLLSSVGAAIGNAQSAGISPRTILVGVVVSLIAWISWAVLVYYLGTRVMPTADTRADAGQLLRTVGFAAAPGMLRVVEVLGIATWLWFPLTSIWMIAAMTVGVRQALDYTSTTRALGVCALGWLLSAAFAAGIGVLFAVPVY